VNVGLLATSNGLDPGEREELVADVQEELESMTAVVGELIELAQGEEVDVSPTEFRLDEIVRAAVDRAAKRSPGIEFRTDMRPTNAFGVPERVERAVDNLVDNARKWSPPGSAVDISVRDGVVEVRDRGPGIAAEDRPFVFDRFYRSIDARGKPGAGLGLAIVKQVADAHDGSVTVEQAPGGGTVLRLALPNR
jgi:two-component system sensor histidine kinase MprB